MDTKEEVADLGLRYIPDSEAGIMRVRKGEGKFEYHSPGGGKVTDEKSLERIKKLVIPPAWERVWICKSPNGYLQVTGFDNKNIKQYRYHPDYVSHRGDKKFGRMLDFGKALPKIRKQVEADLKGKELSRKKVTALAVKLLDTTMIRVGNAEYERKNKSYGLTTLKDKHVKQKEGKLVLEFTGKKGVKQSLPIEDRRVANLVKKCRDIPGYDLLQYLDGDGGSHKIKSEDVNSYVREITGIEFTAKDFRTWGGSRMAIKAVAELEKPANQAEVKKATLEIIKSVSQLLGNTTAVCRKYYIHPKILESIAGPELAKIKTRHGTPTPTADMLPEEKLLMSFLKRC